MPDSVATPPPICPRCGYDLGGTVASWVREGDGASCPTEGVCSECGYALLWRDILNPIYQRLPGFYEHAITRRERVAWGWRTTLWLIFPWVFWGKVKLHHTMRPLRAIRLAAWMIVISLLMRATVAGVGIALRPIGAPGILTPAGSWGASVFRPAWSAAPSNGWTMFDGCFGPRMTWNETWNFSTNPPFAAACIQIESPHELIILAASPVVFALAMTAFIVWVLPETSRLAKLRRAHVWRGAAYAPVAIGLSALANSLFVCILMASDVLEATGHGRSLWFTNLMLVYTILEWLPYIPIPWVIVFWWSAILRGWRFKHGLATCLLLSVGAAAAAGILSALLYLSICWTEDMGRWIVSF